MPLTRQGPDALPWRRTGSFADKAQPVVITLWGLDDHSAPRYAVQDHALSRYRVTEHSGTRYGVDDS